MRITETNFIQMTSTPPSSNVNNTEEALFNFETKGETINMDSFKSSVPATGTDNPAVLANAPSPKVTLNGEEKSCVFVVDIGTNVLFQYDQDGNAIMAYRIASGAPGSPTHTGIRTVSHTENHPYKSAPAHTMRHRDPNAFGPHAIILEPLDDRGRGEFIHGNRFSENNRSIGKYASHGCMRMHNDVINVLYTQVKRGDVVNVIDSRQK